MESVSSFSNILIAIIGFFGVLIGIIWRSQGRRIEYTEEKIKSLLKLHSDVAEIKTDIRWIKEKHFNK